MRLLNLLYLKFLGLVFYLFIYLFNFFLRLHDSAFLSEVTVNHLKTARGEIWPKRSEKTNNQKNYQDEVKINSQMKKPHLKMIPNKDNYKFGTDPTMEDQIRRTNGFIRPKNPTLIVAQRVEALSLYISRWALSEDSGFNSYPSWPGCYFVKNVVR